MRNILIIGAGKSSSSLIKYLLDHAQAEDWIVTVADYSESVAKEKTGNHPRGKAVGFDINKEEQRSSLISGADLVVSMLPANMHIPVAIECLKRKKNLITASYVSSEMQELNKDVISAGLLFLNECGLDPGIDHMSAMQVIDDVRKNGGELQAFRSYTGGLVAPESNDNPWGYKFSWNPRNVILAGQSTAKLIEDGMYKYIPYSRLFLEARPISIDGYGTFDGYPNRDSLAYRKIYGIEGIRTMIRGTLRQSGFCKAWNVFVRLGLTDDSFQVENSQTMSYKSLVESLLPNSVSGNSAGERLAALAGISAQSQEMKMVEWTGILSDEKIGMPNASPAQALQKLLENKWKLRESDKDMIVMQHQFEYILNGKQYFHTSSLGVKGDDSVNTAMAKTVGTPAAIAARLLLNGKISLRGIQVPVMREIYEPVLAELKEYGIHFNEKRTEQA